MDVVILVAGIGSRLKEKTKEIPKCLVKINNKSILERQLEILNEFKFDTIYLVGGYKINKIKELLTKLPYKNIVLLDNFDYLTTNNMYSLSLVEPYLNGHDFIWLNGDILFTKDVIQGMLECNNQNVIACIPNLYLNESMKIKTNGKQVIEISKLIKENDYYATSIDIYLISKETSKNLFLTIKNWLLEDKNSWSELALNAILDKQYFTYYIVNTPWIEIDTIDDYNKALEMFK